MEEKRGYIYKHTNLINHKIYIGQTTQQPEKRWGNGLSQYRHNKHFFAAIKKYGWDNFSHQILKEGLSQEELNYWEKYFISYYDSTNKEKGYNILLGGEVSPFKELWQNPIFKQERSQKQSQFMKQRMANPQIKQQMTKGLKNYWKNSSQARKQQSERMTKVLKELWQNEEYRQKQSLKFEKYLKENQQKHIKQCKENALNNWTNPDFRKKICKKIQNIQTGLIFQSAAAAARWCGLADRSSITKYLTKHTKSAGKHPETKIPLHWKYVEEGGD